MKVLGPSDTGKGILEISDNIECPICLEYKKGVSQPNCNHFTCIDCFCLSVICL